MSLSSSSTSLTVHTNDSGFLAVAIFIFFLLCSVSPSTVCLFTARKLSEHAPCLLLHLWWMSSATYRLEYELQRFRSFSVDANILETMARKTENKKIVFARLDGPEDDVKSSFVWWVRDLKSDGGRLERSWSPMCDLFLSLNRRTTWLWIRSKIMFHIRTRKPTEHRDD